MNELFDSNIYCTVSSSGNTFWDAKLGEEASGFIAEGNFQTLEECARFLDGEACRLYPQSGYARAKLTPQGK